MAQQNQKSRIAPPVINPSFEPEEDGIPFRGYGGQEQNADLLNFYRALCNVRNAESALRRGTRQTIFADGNVLAYRRVDDEGSLVCVLNITDTMAELELDIKESTLLLATSSDCGIQPEGNMQRISIPPFSGMLLK